VAMVYARLSHSREWKLQVAPTIPRIVANGVLSNSTQMKEYDTLHRFAELSQRSMARNFGENCYGHGMLC